MATIVISPGYTNSGADHWQTHLESHRENVVRIEQDNWDLVERDKWINGVQRTLDSLDEAEDLILVGHSCGSISLAQWASENAQDLRVRAIVLVAPADVDSPSALADIKHQRPVPTKPLAYPTILITSDDDPFLSADRALEFARNWRVDEHSRIESGGHLATDDGYGNWPWIDSKIDELLG